MHSKQTCAICLEKGKEKLGGPICQHDADGLVHRECFLMYILETYNVICPICKGLLPIKDILQLAEDNVEKKLFQSLLDRDDDTYIRNMEGYLYYQRPEIKSVAFVIAASFGFTKAAKHFYQQIFPCQSLLERLMQMFKKPELPNHYLLYNFRSIVLMAVLKIKFGTFTKFARIHDIRPIALFCAVLDNSPKMVRTLLEFKAGFDVNCRDMQSYSPLYYSIANDSTEVTKILLEHSAGLGPYHAYSAMAFADAHDRREHKKLLRAYSLRKK